MLYIYCSIKNYGSCPVTEVSKKSKLDKSIVDDDEKRENIYNTVMERLRFVAQHHTAEKKRGNLVADKLLRIDEGEGQNDLFKTVDGLDMHPVSSKEVPEQDEKYYNKDWLGVDENGPLTAHARSHDDNKNIKINLRFHFVNDSLNGNHQNVLNMNAHEDRTRFMELGEYKGDMGEEKSERIHTIRLRLPEHKNEMMKSKDVETEKTSKNATRSLNDSPDGLDGHDKSSVNSTHDTHEHDEHDTHDAPETNRLHERFHQDYKIELKEEDELKERLYKSKERLYNTSLLEKEKSERFHLINGQLNSIDKEIDYLEHDIQNKRFHSNENNTDEEVISLQPSSSDEKNNRFHQDNTTSNATEINRTKKNLSSTTTRFHDNDGDDAFIDVKDSENTPSLEKPYSRWDKKASIIRSNPGHKSKGDLLPVRNINFDSAKMHKLINEVLQDPVVEKESKEYMKN